MQTNMEECKMFIGGLTRDTTADMLQAYFNFFGRVVHAIVMTNPETKKSRGFGFITFDRTEIVDRVLISGPHFIDGKQIDPKPSVPKDMRPKPPSVEQPKKAFLGGLPLDMNEADMREFFSMYGVVTECYIMFDEKRMKSRGFGFVSFEDDSIVDELVKQHYIDVRDKRVEVKLARPRENPLAPLNSEGRVMSQEAQETRSSGPTVQFQGPPHRQMAYDHYPFYGDQNPQQKHPYPFPDRYDSPRAKRQRVQDPSSYAAPSNYLPDYYNSGGSGYGYGYGHPAYAPEAQYSDQSYPMMPPPAAPQMNSQKRPRFPPAPALAPAPAPPPPAQPALNPASLYRHPFPMPPEEEQAVAGTAADVKNMSPESMTTLMQQAMQNMAGGMGMMMPMFMSNMVTQMFMNQAQTMFQNMMQKRTSDEQNASASSTTNSDMVEVMKNVLQNIMGNMQQQQQMLPGSTPSKFSERAQD